MTFQTRKDGGWYASIASEKSKRTKVFALVGDVNNTGLIEVPVGIKLRDLVYTLRGVYPEIRSDTLFGIGDWL